MRRLDEAACQERARVDGPAGRELAGAWVRESAQAGAFYCAHLFWCAAVEAERAGSSVVKSARGEPFVGFLHVPADERALGLTTVTSTDPAADLLARHQATIQVLATAIAGLVDALRQAPIAAPLRFLFTGFGPFAGVVDNPTGEIVSTRVPLEQGFLRAAPQLSSAPLRLVGRRVEEEAGAALQRFALVDDGGAPCFEVAALRCAVDDVTLDPVRPGSIQWAMARWRPHVVIGMGVHRGRDFRVETCADTAGLSWAGGAPRHCEGRPPDRALPVNRVLARALGLRGA